MTTERKNKSEYVRALDSLTRYLAQRDHSRHELKTKLSRRFENDLVELLIREAEERGWLLDEAAIAERLVLSLERKLKSRRYIEEQLRKRRLPVPPSDHEAESERARAVAERKFGSVHGLKYEEKIKVIRFLKYRGFNDHAIQQVFHAKP